MPNPYFQFKQFTVHHDRCAMKVTTDSCFFGAWAAEGIRSEELSIENVLDIGTGSGLLSLMIAQKNALQIDAVEIDSEAAGQAAENVETSKWRNSISIHNADIRYFLPCKKYDCIICNPPFYENELASAIHKKNIAHHSEELTVSQVLSIIKMHLKEDGIFFLMYPFKRKDEIEGLIKTNGLSIREAVVLSQSVQHSPFRMIIKGDSKNHDSVSSTSIAVWNEHQQYTEQFSGLLKDYYLYL